ncbi:MAG: beta-galactosidase [Phycisphaerales bacterium]
MSVITNDGHSFMVQGRRVWLVSGTVHHARVPRALWSERLRAAKQAGLNCIETPLVWSNHEPQPGRISFEGQNDIAAFVKEAIALGLYVIVRIGPAVGDGYDLGGLPAWLIPETEGRLRQGDPAFLQRCATWLSAVCQQIASLQVTKRRKDAEGGILLVQTEHKWFYHDDAVADAYLGELVRYLREGGITVPVLNRNNLFQSMEGEIDTWSGREELHAVVRQLRTVAPTNPRLVMGYHMGDPPVWGEAASERLDPSHALRGAAEILAGGGQFNLAPFHAGTLLGWQGGRLERSAGAFCCTGWDEGVPLGERGARGAGYGMMKRICTFARSFDRVLSAMDPDYHPVAVSPDALGDDAGADGGAGRRARSRAKTARQGPVSVIHAQGSLGSIVWLFSDPSSSGVQRTNIVMPKGATLPVSIGEQGAAWVLLGTHLHGRSTLDYCTLNAFAGVGRTFVCFGPPGEQGLLSINGSAIPITAPTGKTPDLIEHEGVVAVVCNDEIIDHAYATGEGVWIGIDGFDAQNEPITIRGSRKALFVDRDGKADERQLDRAPSLAGTKGRIDPIGWRYADTREYTSGTSQRFALIDGPTPMEALGAPDGYGWLRLVFKSGTAKRAKVALPESGDRLHLYLDAEPLEIAGIGPGASGDMVTLPLKKREHTVGILIDNLGRTASGLGMGEFKGLYGAVHEIKPLKPDSHGIETGAPVEVSTVRVPFYGHAKGETTSSDRASALVQHRKKSALIVTVDGVALDGALLVNDQPVSPVRPGGLNRFVLDPEKHLSRGKNLIQVALLGSPAGVEAALKQIKFHIFESVNAVTDKAAWAFAKWECPPDAAFEEVAKSRLSGKSSEQFAGRPAWWRLSFEVPHTEAPLLLEADGLSKGIIMLNGEHCGRYWVSTADGTPVGPQTRYYLPEPWLNTDGPNELTLFDEHGFTPDKVKLVYEG